MQFVLAPLAFAVDGFVAFANEFLAQFLRFALVFFGEILLFASAVLLVQIVCLAEFFLVALHDALDFRLESLHCL